jgi:hypothetical protein
MNSKKNSKKSSKKSSKKTSKKINYSLYKDDHPQTSTKGTGFKDKQKALDTIKIIKDRDLTYQKQVVLTMYNRAKYHPHQTHSMKDAMKVYSDWLKKYNK